MFTWIPIHQEAARKLAGYENRQDELIDLLRRMHQTNLSALKIKDQDGDGNPIDLDEVDPFTFLANFNRPNTQDNRRALWQFIKQDWNLSAAVPDDFDGLPLMNHQKSWLLPYQKDRDPNHVPTLWKFFTHILETAPESLNTALMNQCIDFKETGMTNLTMGMFWARPDTWISTDRKNIEYAQQNGSRISKPSNASEYPAWLASMKTLCNGDALRFSHDAHVWATGGGNGGNGGVPPDAENKISEPESSGISRKPRYWLVAPGEGAFLWDECRRANMMSIGWDETGDRTGLKTQKEHVDSHAAAFPDASPGKNAAVGKMLFDFGNTIRPGDLIFAKKGHTDVLGWGVVTGECRFDGDREQHYHIIPVDWKSTKVAPSAKQLPTKTVTEKTNDPDFLELIRTYYGLPRSSKPRPVHDDYTFESALSELFMEDSQLRKIVRRLKDKKNIIGTMNTADRSLSMVDYALRRRFSFVTMEPGFHIASFAAHLGNRGISDAEIGKIRQAMAGINHAITEDTDLGPGYRIGHSFFTPDGMVGHFPTWYSDRLEYEIFPLLEEYWMDDPDKVAAMRKHV